MNASIQEKISLITSSPSPINPLLTAKDILHCMNLVQPTHVAVSAAYYEKVQEVLSRYGSKIPPRVFSVIDQIDRVEKVG